jgi:hypothetical protein
MLVFIAELGVLSGEEIRSEMAKCVDLGAA